MSKNPSTPYKGQCLCGAITYEVTAIQPRMAHCHCTMCRKFHGAAFATFGEAKPNHFRWTNGETLLMDYVAENGTTRQFCKHCGSSLTFSPAENPDGLVEFSLATLDTKLDLHPDAHIYVKSKTNWFEISDDLPQFACARVTDS